MPAILLDTAALKLSLEPSQIPSGFDLVAQAAPNVVSGFGLYRLVPSGPQLTLGATLAFDVEGRARLTLFEPLRPGLYVVALGPPPTGNQITFPGFAPPPAGRSLWIGEGRPLDLDAAVHEALAEHKAFAEREFRQEGYEGDARQALHVIVDGCLLDYPQGFEGGYLQPIPHRLGVRSIVDAVNVLLPVGVTFDDIAALDESYGREHPLALVTFRRVFAEDDANAIQAVQPRLQRILGALTLDRGASPIPLAYLSERSDNTFSMRAAQHGIYRGNLVSGFGPGITGLLDVVERASRKDPWTIFALGLYRGVKIQIDPSAQVYQAWSMIEGAAKRRYPADASVPVKNAEGKKISSQGKDLGRVILYLRDQVGLNVLTLGLQPTGDFYAVVTELYQARNRIAHEGGVNSPHNPNPAPNIHALAWTARDWAAVVVRHELMTAGGE